MDPSDLARGVRGRGGKKKYRDEGEGESGYGANRVK